MTQFAPPAPHENVVVLTGAGVSAESGISTFRDANGLWERYRFDEVASPRAFAYDPALVWRFYKMRWENASSAQPNAGHFALAELERGLGERFTLVTQNVDGLHQASGSKRVLEMHGSLRRTLCTQCGATHPTDTVDLAPSIPSCPSCNGDLRPDIVWFGETPHYLKEIDSLLRNADVLLVAGTSGNVYPAAQFVHIASHFGARTLAVNLEPPENASAFDAFMQGKSGDVLPELANAWLSG